MARREPALPVAPEADESCLTSIENLGVAHEGAEIPIRFSLTSPLRPFVERNALIIPLSDTYNCFVSRPTRT